LDDERPGSLDADFHLPPELSDIPGFTARPQPDGTIILVGNTSNGKSRIIRLERDGSIGLSLDVNAGVRSVAVQPDGKMVIGGSFESINNVSRRRLARLAPDGTLDLSYNPDAAMNIEYGVSSVLIQVELLPFQAIGLSRRMLFPCSCSACSAGFFLSLSIGGRAGRGPL
jgi:hypothetical protein